MLNRLVIFVAVCLMIPQVLYSRSDLSELLTPPLDSTAAFMMDIWVPVEKIRSCRVKINIFDQSGQLVREFMDEILPEGYHHFYWDKKDDSGKYVNEGEYSCLIKLCNKKSDKRKTMKVQYASGERDILISIGENLKEPFFEFEILTDKSKLSLDLMNRRGKILKTIFSDSIFVKGKYRYDWSVETKLRSTKYWFKLTVNNYPHLIKLIYRSDK